MHQKTSFSLKKSENFSGKGHSFLPRPLFRWGVDTPPHTVLRSAPSLHPDSGYTTALWWRKEHYLKCERVFAFRESTVRRSSSERSRLSVFDMRSYYCWISMQDHDWISQCRDRPIIVTVVSIHKQRRRLRHGERGLGKGDNK